MAKLRRLQSARLIGFEVISVKPGEAVVELQTSEKHANPMGTVHGGVLCDIADAAMGIAYAANLAEGASFTTLELKIIFSNPSRTHSCAQPHASSNKANGRFS